VLSSHQSIRDVAPFPYYTVNHGGEDGTETNELNFVIVPKQLEEATVLPARTSSSTHARVYGEGWHVAIDSTTRKEDIERAQEMYDFSHHNYADDDDNDDADADAVDDMDDDYNDDVSIDDDDEMILPHTDEDAIVLIVNDRLSFDDPALIFDALVSLYMLLHPGENGICEDNRKVAVREGASRAIVDAMILHEGLREVQFRGILCLTLIAECQIASILRNILENGGITTCIRAMARFPAYAELQAVGCFLIGIMWLHEEVRKAVAEEGALPAVLNAMNNHKRNVDVQEIACWALFALLLVESSLAEAAVNLGCIDAVIDSMGQHRNNAIVQQYGCGALGAVAKSSDDCRDRVIDGHGLVAVEQAQEIHGDNVQVVNAATTAIYALSSPAPARRSTSPPRSGSCDTHAKPYWSSSTFILFLVCVSVISHCFCRVIIWYHRG
jgi:Armadillo/beta-catenin-like repeat